MIEHLLNKLRDPDKEYRPVPFWSWNDALEPEFLKWQIAEMDKVGIGGYFMHARAGLETEYLSEEWMQCVGVCIEEGKKRGMKPWLYDEVGWPSGFAGGMVTALGDKYHARGLKMEEWDISSEFPCDENILGVYLLEKGSNTITPVKSKEEVLKFKPDSVKGLIVRHISGPYYIDVMNEEAVRAFINCTHERYYDRFKDEFGKNLHGFFTDEPRFSVEQIPWSYVFQERFKQKYGYDIVDYLPALFIPCEGYQQVRYDFWALANELFVSAFIKQIYEWCDSHSCKLTGHIMMEESLYSQMTSTGGVMPFYEYMHIPGVDWLRRMIFNPIVPKQVSSVASQLGKKQVLTESFALCGWNVSFEELKWIAEWQYVNGVNLMCQHLQSYTLRGLRKRDYPPSLFFQQPWWEEYRIFNDYLARLGVLLTSGKPVAKVLVLHPIRSAWIAYDGTYTEELKKLDRDFVRVSEWLSGLHVDYHYGDETIISKYGRVESNRFVVGRCSYDVVVMPSMLTVDVTTVELLSEFIDNGGCVIVSGDFPELCCGRRDERLNILKNKVRYIKDKDELYDILKNYSVPTISVRDGNGCHIENIRYHQRDMGDVQIFFLVNHSQTEEYTAEIEINGKGRIRLLDLNEVPQIKDLPYVFTQNTTKARLVFRPMQSYVVLWEKFKGEEEFLGDERMTDNLIKGNADKEIVVVPSNEWDIESMDLNSLTLDYCYYSIDGEQWEGPIAVIKLFDKLLEMRRSCNIALKFNFEVEMNLSRNKEMFLVMEEPDKFEIEVNGQKIKYEDIGWWKDSAFKKIDIKGYVKKGTNEIILRRTFYQRPKVYEVLFGENVYESEKNMLTYDVELESIYIVGDFGVVSKSSYKTGERKAVFTDGPFVIVDKPDKVKTGDLTRQGFCFFAGKITLTQTIYVKKEEGMPVILKLKRPNAIVAKVFINDRVVKTLPWEPYSVDITEAVRDGENKLSIQLFSSNRNLLGPHHHVAGESYSVGPLSFVGKFSFAEKQTEAVPTTEEEMSKDYWREGYCFVEFGLN